MASPLYTHQATTQTVADDHLLCGILDHIADPVFVKDRNHRFIYGNDAFWNMLGGDAEKYLGKSDYDFFPKEEADVFWEKDNAVFETGEIILNEEFLTDANGIQHVLSTKKAVFLNNGEPVLVGIIRDITALKEIDRLKNDFVSMVSHELRTPLTSIRASLELLTSDELHLSDEDMRNMIHIALRNTDRLERIVQQILDVEKIKSGKMPLYLQPISLTTFLTQAIEDNAIYGRKYDVTFSLDKAANDTTIIADANSLMQIMTNLLSNAAKFSHKGEVVTIRILDHSAYSVMIEVEDNGIGIPETFHHHIFGRFQRAELSATHNRDGTGLGLNICKHLMEAMNGCISFESRHNKGSIFRIELPKANTL